MTTGSFRAAFHHRHAVLPVIHVVDGAQALRNSRIAIDAGADGVFLINHEIGAAALLSAFATVRDALPTAWIGLNVLGMAPSRLFMVLPAGVSGVWVDNAMTDQPAEAERVRSAQQRCLVGWTSPKLYFGGVAFKYQPAVDDLERAAARAVRWVDVVTTSGDATGQAPSHEKIATMKRAIGAAPLAIASGITPNNVARYLPIADAFLVATGISKSFTELDEGRTRLLVERVRS
jgi:uncharacterized protein